ncbi:tRNA lysidine(34) synthetase TilS [Magnetococcus sp. PR-3]|uniref:tRNA lysidine(34) synthetase TilS n=1 Tax=Magnetococcus sp. PR-3 TaxID=3120355 RepID=UPI002FCE37E1
MDDKKRAALVRRFQAHLANLLPQWPLSTPLLVAVSAGVDSTALLHLLKACYPGPLHAAHFDHALRPCSALDLAHLIEQCQNNQIKLHHAQWSPPDHKSNLAAKARQARYAFLGDVAQQISAPFIAIAHHQEDQAETMLERLLLRGVGLKGLRGMRPIAPLPYSNQTTQLLRPLLSLSKSSLTQWLEGERISWREDPSNQDLRYTRNRIRHRLIPSLEHVASPAPLTSRLAQTAEHLQQADAALNWMTQRLLEELAPQPWQEKGVQIPFQPYVDLPTELRARLLDHWIFSLTGVPSVGHRAKYNLWQHLQLPAKYWKMNMRGVTIQRAAQYLQIHTQHHAPGKRGETNH